jgi:hypothetical protein
MLHHPHLEIYLDEVEKLISLLLKDKINEAESKYDETEKLLATMDSNNQLVRSCIELHILIKEYFIGLVNIDIGRVVDKYNEIAYEVNTILNKDK